MKASIKDSINNGWKSSWLEEIEAIRERINMEDMCGCFSRYEWNKKVNERIANWEMEQWTTEKENKVSLRWFPTTRWTKGRRQDYVDGSEAAKYFFQVKSGSMVLKKNGRENVICKVCREEDDSEIHRILKCRGSTTWRRDWGGK